MGLDPRCSYGPTATHRQLLVVGHLVRQGPNPLIGPIHVQPRAEPRQLLIAPRMVPVWAEEGIEEPPGPAPARPPPAPRSRRQCLPVVVGGEDRSERHVLLPDDF